MNTTARWGASLVCSLVLAFGAAGVAGAQDGTDPYIGPSPEVDSEVVESGVPADVQGQTLSAGAATTASAPEVQGSSLAFTGGDVMVLMAVGLGAVAAGGALLVSRRRALD